RGPEPARAGRAVGERGTGPARHRADDRRAPARTVPPGAPRQAGLPPRGGRRRRRWDSVTNVSPSELVGADGPARVVCRPLRGVARVHGASRALRLDTSEEPG